MKNTIDCISHEQCTGCGACFNKCPVDAIKMLPDREGFLFPNINTEKCINCGLCLKACPVNDVKAENNPEPSCYAVIGDDELRKKSSSGGVFSLIADWILERGGVVCGAAFTDDCYSVEHIVIESRDQLHKLRGSKYVQSDTKNVYRAVAEHLKNKRPVLFTGTPCQIAGINSFLGKPDENLYTIDLVCHGVPSPFAYEKFIKEQEEKNSSKVVRVSFRDKDVIKWNISTTLEFENGEIARKKRDECPYIKSFLKLLMFRKSCGKCQFARIPRQGDMTIADFWGVRHFDQKLDDGNGTSLVLPNNSKGFEMLKVLEKSAKVVKEAPLEIAAKYNAQLKHSSLHHARRNRFYSLLSDYDYGFEKAVDYGFNRKFDIGFIGWWYGSNYGSVLTNFALHQVLTGMKKSVLMLEWPIVSGPVPEKKPDNKTRRFVNNFYDMSLMNRLEDYGKFNHHCDTFVVGSDQLWNWWSNRNVGTYHFFLDFVDGKHKKIAYSTSFGHDSAYYPDDMVLKLSYLLHRFDAISVRETSAVEVCKKRFDVDAIQTADPVFLCDIKEYDKAIELSKVEIKEPYVLAYILNPTPEKIESVRYAAEKMKLPYHIILDGQAKFEDLKAEANDPNVLENVEIADWLKYFKNASYVITDSFHGFCFSIIFRRNVSVFPNKKRGLARFDTLSETTGLENRLHYSKSDFVNSRQWEDAIDYDRVYAKLTPQVEESRKWLIDALEAPKTPTSTRLLELKAAVQAQEEMKRLKASNTKLTEKVTNLEKANQNKKSVAPQNSVKVEKKSLIKAFLKKVKRKIKGVLNK